jgi:Uncharacterized protein conserved in bacteria (DUF2252)
MSPTEKKNTTVAGTLARDKAPESFSRRTECLAAGKRLRDRVPRTSHAPWSGRSDHRDPIDLLKLSNRDRVSDLVPIRYGRMLRSPLTFLRGAAGLMARDLAHTPITGPRVQACGDCHLLNFGLFATPERNLIFDINDFDETLPAPWEWDLKRLAVSFAVASRDNGHSERQAESAAVACVRAYRTHLSGYSKQSPLQVWYARLDEHAFIEAAPDLEARRTRRAIARKARQRVGEYLFPKIATRGMNQFRLVDQPPLIFHPAERDWDKRIRAALDAYRKSLPDERRLLFERYKLQDVAFQSGRHRQRRHALLCGALLLGRPATSAAAVQGSQGFGARALCGQESVRESRTTRRDWATADAISERHLPWLGPWCEGRRCVRASAARHEDVGADRGNLSTAALQLRRSVRLDARACAREIRQRRLDQWVPRQGKRFRPSDGQVCVGLRRPEREGSRCIGGRGEKGSNPRAGRGAAMSRDCHSRSSRPRHRPGPMAGSDRSVRRHAHCWPCAPAL